MAKDRKKVVIGLGIAGLMTTAIILATRKPKVAKAESASEPVLKQVEEDIEPLLPPGTTIEDGIVQTYDPITGTLILNTPWTEYALNQYRELFLAQHPELTEADYWAAVKQYQAYIDWTKYQVSGMSVQDAAERSTDWLLVNDTSGNPIEQIIPPAVKEARMLWEYTGMVNSFNLRLETELYNSNPAAYNPQQRATAIGEGGVKSGGEITMETMDLVTPPPSELPTATVKATSPEEAADLAKQGVVAESPSGALYIPGLTEGSYSVYIPGF